MYGYSYDEGKRAAETIAFDYHRAHGVEIRVARIFNTYGPRMNIHDGRVVSNFITQVNARPSPSFSLLRLTTQCGGMSKFLFGGLCCACARR